MTKKGLNKLQIVILFLVIVLFILPFATSLIQIVVRNNTVHITAIYVGKNSADVGAVDANITNISGSYVYRDYSSGTMELDKPYNSYNASLKFWDSLCSSTYSSLHPCLLLGEGDYTFSIAAEDTSFAGGQIIRESENFSVDLSWCMINGIKDPLEECDDQLGVGSTTCADLGFVSGSVTCSGCEFDTSNCIVCTARTCDECANLVCAPDGSGWTTVNYTRLCGRTDSNIPSALGARCTSSACDVAANEVCDANRYWTGSGFCGNCTGVDSTCPIPCTTGSCDIGSQAYCNFQEIWRLVSAQHLTIGDYCNQCGEFDSECNACDNSNDDACDTDANKYCDGSNWVSTDYCQHCGNVDADCGIPVCTHGACDVCPDGKKYCNQGVWETDDYCTRNKCGLVDSSCGRDCSPDGLCDTNGKMICIYGFWDQDQYCEFCKGEDSSLYCYNTSDCGNARIDRWQVDTLWVGEACDGTNLNGMTCQRVNDIFVGGQLSCNPDCLAFNTSRCVVDYCGDGVIDMYTGTSDEECDSGNLGGTQCTTLGFSGGSLACDNECHFDTSGCTSLPGPECGDGVINQVSEDCDGSDLGGATCMNPLGYASGTLSCNSDCTFNTGSCVPGTDPYCGDGNIDLPNGAGINEECDSSNLGGRLCTYFDSYTGGTLACKGDCSFDTSGCTGGPGPTCGDGVYNQVSEDCDGNDLNGRTCATFGYNSGTLRCYSDCTFDKRNCVSIDQECGDNIIQKPNDAGFNEDCDNNNLGNQQCTDFDSYTGGLLDCYGDCTYDYSVCVGGPGPTCGDNIVNQLSEDCDGSSLSGHTCVSLGYASGNLGCYNDCTYDKSNCVPGTTNPRVCGDGLVQHPNDAGIDEKCDGTNLESKQCTDFAGYTSGNLACYGDCTFDFLGCSGGPLPYCGDNIVNQLDEDCDRYDLSGESCVTLGYSRGTLRCYSGCTFDKRACVSDIEECGDAIIQRPNDANLNEQCDTNTFNSNEDECTDHDNYTGGTLACDGYCSFNYAGCIAPGGVCGDGRQGTDEECDYNDANGINGTLCTVFDSSRFSSGLIRCNSLCEIDLTSCTPIIDFCGDGKITRGEQCDDRLGIGTMRCTDFGTFTGGSLRCSNCEYDTSRCTGPTGGFCGDNTVVVGEQCDGGLGSMTCEDFDDFSSGTLRCVECKYDTTNCIEPGGPSCGDDVVNQGTEECDRTDLDGWSCLSMGYVSGTLDCNADCSFDKSGCISTLKRCGDSRVDKPNDFNFNEECDGSNLDNKQCSNYDDYTGGTLSCSGGCAFNFDSCTGSPTGPYCGDGVVNQLGEDCDGSHFAGWTCQAFGYDSGTLSCTSSCTFDKSNCARDDPVDDRVCGDAVVDHPNDAGFDEQCDGTNVESKSCTNFDSYTGGSLACYGDCTLNYAACTGGTYVCNDGVKNQVSEDCDGNDLGGYSCETLGYTGGTLRCTSSCKFDKSSCTTDTDFCGDRTVDKPNDFGFNEQCDGTNLDNNQCSDFDDYSGGILTCDGDCTFDESSCTGGTFICGDGVVNQETEDCDGTDFDGWTCIAFGYDRGSLSCTSSCTFVKSNCVSDSPNPRVCGDTTVQHPNDAGFEEECDGTNLETKDCQDFDDYTSGTLDCFGDCTFDYTNCEKPTGDRCGDGIINDYELCDGVDWGDITGCADLPGFTGGSLSCDIDCHYNTNNCIPEVPPPECGNGILEPGEKCDGGVGSTTCNDIGHFAGGSLKCDNANCVFDKTNCVKNETDPYCGDNLLNGVDETCDGTSYSSYVTGCASFTGYGSGTLGCYDDCSLDFGMCILGNGTPIAAHCTNDVTDGDETDLNCGGISCPKCALGRRCLINEDCISIYCNSYICAEASCFDKVKNGGETDVDCGGPCEKKCDVGQGCRAGFADCLAGLFCNPDTLSCVSPTCSDVYQNGDETDVDCGGGCPDGCVDGKKCISSADCMSKYCEDGICNSDPDTDTDGDGMPDKWEMKYGLNPNDPSDADKDYDGDGRSNLDEYLDGTDPTKKDGPEKKNRTLQTVLLIIGLLLMLGSTGFLIYSRKVLVPQQKAAMPAERGAPPKVALTKRPLRSLLGLKPRARRTGPGGRLAQKRKSLLKGFGEEDKKPSGTGAAETKPGVKPGVGPGQKPGVPGLGKGVRKPSEPKEDFIPIEKLGKKPDAKPVAKPGQKPGVPAKMPAKPSPTFEKLKAFSEEVKGKKEIPGAEGQKGVDAKKPSEKAKPKKDIKIRKI